MGSSQSTRLSDAISLASHNLMIAFSLPFPFQQQSAILIFALLARLPAVQFCAHADHQFGSEVHTHIPFLAYPQLASMFPEKSGQQSLPLSFKVEESQ